MRAALTHRYIVVQLAIVGLWGFANPAAHAADAPAAASAAACPATLQHTYLRLQDEKPQSLCQYAGKVLYSRYKDKGLVVLGFPSNDFAQEKSSNKEIADFCENTFGVKFPMFAKTAVRGADASPLYKQLAQLSGTAPKWNFHKYLLGRDGRLVDNYSSMTAPDSKSLVRAIEQQLAMATPR